MTSPTHPPVEAADLVDPASAESVEKTEIPAFKFPFKPGELAGAKMPPSRGTRTAPRTGIPSPRHGAAGHPSLDG